MVLSRMFMIFVFLVGFGILSLQSQVNAAPILHRSLDPEIELQFYPVGSSNGPGSIRNRGFTFGSFEGKDDEGNTFYYEGSGAGPARRGIIVIATDTSNTIPTGLDPARYQINSVRTTATIKAGQGAIAYDNTAEISSELTPQDANSPQDDFGRPIELWGVGFNGDFETFGFNGETEARYFNAGDQRWIYGANDSVSNYQIYTIDPDGNDVENSAYGGYSLTAENNHTEQFSPTPFAIGKSYTDEAQTIEVAPGTLLGKKSEYVFTPDLTNDGVVSYLQKSLAAGHLGFIISSLHGSSGHTDGPILPYPDYYLDNFDNKPNLFGNGPTIEIEVTILPEIQLVGDYNHDGSVTEADFDFWKQNFGSTENLAADGNGNGVIDAADFTVWRDNYTASTSGVSSTFKESIQAVPEPKTFLLFAFGSMFFLFIVISKTRAQRVLA